MHWVELVTEQALHYGQGKAKVSLANKEYSLVNEFLVKNECILFSSRYLYTRDQSKSSGKKYYSNAYEYIEFCEQKRY